MRKVSAIAALLGSAGMTLADDAAATTYTATLNVGGILTDSNRHRGYPLNGNSSTSLTWSYDDVTNLMTQTGGTLNSRATTAPTSTLFRQFITGLVISPSTCLAWVLPTSTWPSTASTATFTAPAASCRT